MLNVMPCFKCAVYVYYHFHCTIEICLTDFLLRDIFTGAPAIQCTHLT